MSVDELSATKCRVLACRPVVGGDQFSVDELSVDGLSLLKLLEKVVIVMPSVVILIVGCAECRGTRGMSS